MALALCLVLVLLLAHPVPAAACGAGPFDPREHTELLVLGRARSIELDARTNTDFVEATVTLEILRIFRGSTASPLRFVDSSSVFLYRDPYTGKDKIEFAGGSGACGTIDDDPIDRYVLIALARGEDARWHANRLYGAIYPINRTTRSTAGCWSATACRFRS
ncbi:MAG TPA: hypothetical protein VI056_00995 [Candidatus Limnocylindria bacterium]